MPLINKNFAKQI